MNIDNVFLMFHIFSVIAWFMALPVGILIRRAMVEVDAIGKVKEFAGWAKSTQYLTTGGALGILITGGALAGDRWFQFVENGNWLAIKQVLFFIALIYGVVVVRGAYKNLNQVINDDNSTKNEVVSTYRKVEMQGHILITVVFINIILATLKPF